MGDCIVRVDPLMRSSSLNALLEGMVLLRKVGHGECDLVDYI